MGEIFLVEPVDAQCGNLGSHPAAAVVVTCAVRVRVGPLRGADVFTFERAVWNVLVLREHCGVVATTAYVDAGSLVAAR